MASAVTGSRRAMGWCVVEPRVSTFRPQKHKPSVVELAES